MPALNKPVTTMALVPQPETSGAVAITTDGPSAELRRPRQPTSLQGLLRFAMEATKAEDAPRDSEFQPMDEERKQFLENALKSMTIDVVEVLQRQITVLKKVETIGAEDDASEYEVAIETILEYVDNIDIANDFHKIGGFMILYPCLKSPHPRIRAGGCELLAVICQNNPYCQQIVLDNEFVPLLISTIEKDEMSVAVKALYALGGIIRDNPEGVNQFLHYDGLSVLLSTIKRNHEKFIIKATFLLTTLCQLQPDLKAKLLELGYLRALIALILTPRSESHEHVLALLVILVEENPDVLVEYKSTNNNLKDYLQTYVNNIRHKEEFEEEEKYCRRLLHVLNSET